MLNKNISRRSFLSLSTMTAATFILDWNKVWASASKIVSKNDHPIIIIGAGLGGLCCGAYLAKQGFPVTIV